MASVDKPVLETTKLLFTKKMGNQKSEDSPPGYFATATRLLPDNQVLKAEVLSTSQGNLQALHLQKSH